MVGKVASTDGHVAWATPITLLPSRDKIASPLKEFCGRIIAVTGRVYRRRPLYVFRSGSEGAGGWNAGIEYLMNVRAARAGQIGAELQPASPVPAFRLR